MYCIYRKGIMPVCCDATEACAARTCIVLYTQRIYRWIITRCILNVGGNKIIRNSKRLYMYNVHFKSAQFPYRYKKLN